MAVPAEEMPRAPGTTRILAPRMPASRSVWGGGTSGSSSERITMISSMCPDRLATSQPMPMNSSSSGSAGSGSKNPETRMRRPSLHPSVRDARCRRTAKQPRLCAISAVHLLVAPTGA